MPHPITHLVAWLRSLFTRPQHPSAGQRTTPTRPGPAPVSVWATPWPTPVPAHVLDRHRTVSGDDVSLVRPYVLRWEQEAERRRRAERRMALVLAEAGAPDVPSYSYAGNHFDAVSAA
ncbi:hypothetical protein RKE29_02880 [Streptomyces sp. B1866]|uniref:hypothetical protein n=1 Tax=Streptomyces sp. B1866 TaxID=3075431 RepID=UPI0028912262|nr:hypothetical protein [Streptomyces sp. B1866]MDT3395604.1 hypothetical protein [Streptomyces sp. B1866]